MSKPLEILGAFIAAEDAVDERKRAARQLVREIVNVRAQVGSHREAIATLAKRHGLTNLIAELPEEVGATTKDVLATIDQVWWDLSPSPVPETPDEPEPEPEPESEVKQ